MEITKGLEERFEREKEAMKKFIIEYPAMALSILSMCAKEQRFNIFTSPEDTARSTYAKIISATKYE